MRRLLPLLFALALVVPLGPAALADPGPPDEVPPDWARTVLDRLFNGLFVGSLLAQHDDEAEVQEDPDEVNGENGTEDSGEEILREDLETEEAEENGDNGTEDNGDNGEADDNGTEDNGDNGEADETVEEVEVPKGWIVSTVARCAPVGPGIHGVFDGLRNHGAFVTAAAHGNDAFEYNGGTFDLSTLEGAEGLCEAISNFSEDENGNDTEDGNDENGDGTENDTNDNDDNGNGTDNDDNGNGTDNDDNVSLQGLDADEVETRREQALARVQQLREQAQAAAERGAERRDEAHERRDARAEERAEQERGNGNRGNGGNGAGAATGSAGGPGNGGGPPEGRGPGNGRGPSR